MTANSRENRPLFAGFALAALCFGVPNAEAGAVFQNGVGLHISPVRTSQPCNLPPFNSLWETVSSVSELSTPNGPFYFVYVLGCDYHGGPGLAGVEFGIDYPGAFDPAGVARPISVYGWTSCASQEFPSAGWPGPLAGNLILWSCPPGPPQPTEVAYRVAGYFYLGAYAPARLSIIPHPITGKVQVGDCSGVPHDVTMPPQFAIFQGAAGFALSGWPACLGIPLATEPTSWSRIKALKHE